MDWQQEIEDKAAEEFASLSGKPTSELIEMIRNEQYGDYHVIWKALTLHGSLKDIGWVLFDALKSIGNETSRVACATALIQSLCASGLKTKPFHFLDTNESLSVNLAELENELRNRVGTK